ncbi:HD domain-containing protein [Tumebacillus permanentifrigoris]|uniref:Putative hydrolase of HD superfamily n=1 Tax=Tumebacillus permanentifrigoris TaxID=378543 RepID=A0A316DVN1_9BACL|nr:HD domain-containing protein [Tumebacillus permanentifrigoris]PWK13405.1 putative hydrolase of HD superfamily [Tumebacillus permanentifrigoris]
MGIHNYFKSLSDLEGINRCPGKFKYQEHSVASHSFKVTKIAQFLATVEEADGTVIDWKRLYEKAINHDYAELFTGDIKTPVKYAMPELKELFSQVEDMMIKNFIEKEFPAEFQSIYHERFAEGKDESIEGRILAVADKIDLLYESFGEIQRGNPEPLFLEIYQEALSTILKFQEMPCVQYFVENILQEMLEEGVIPYSQIYKLTKNILGR